MTENEIDDYKYVCCILGVDLVFTQNFRDLRNDYPLPQLRLKIGKVVN